MKNLGVFMAISNDTRRSPWQYRVTQVHGHHDTIQWEERCCNGNILLHKKGPPCCLNVHLGVPLACEL